MTTNLQKLTDHHKNLHAYYVRVATTWPADDPNRQALLDLISSVMELVEIQIQKVRN